MWQQIMPILMQALNSRNSGGGSGGQGGGGMLGMLGGGMGGGGGGGNSSGQQPWDLRGYQYRPNPLFNSMQDENNTRSSTKKEKRLGINEILQALGGGGTPTGQTMEYGDTTYPITTNSHYQLINGKIVYVP